MTARIAGDTWQDFVLGCASLEPGRSGGLVPHRLPAWARAQVDDALFALVEGCPAGVTLSFETAATRAVLTLATTTVAPRGVEPAPPVLVVRSGGEEGVVTAPPPTVVRIGADQSVLGVDAQPPAPVELPLPVGAAPGVPRRVDVFLPHNARVELIALEAEGAVTPAETGDQRRWTHYGGSISQGLNAVSAVHTWPAAAARALGWRLRDLSFAGNAQLDGFVARMIRDIPADLITLKVGINLVNADSMRERAFRPAAHAFLDTIRAGQPETPIVLITALACPIHEDAPGPVVGSADGMVHAARRDVENDQGALTLARTREILTEVAAVRDDPRLSVLDGRELFGEADASLLYDRLHPDQEGLDLIAERFVARFGPDGASAV